MSILLRQPLILASASPRRAQLLSRHNVTYEVRPSSFEEPPPQPGQAIRHYVSELAWNKAWDIACKSTGGWVLAADTAGELDGEVLNKPLDRADAERMIRMQEGREVAIHTGVCLMRAGAGFWHGFVETSVLYMRPLTDQERLAYLDSHAWQGKAGAYGVQDDDPIVSVVSGSWSNIVGLPVETLLKLLQELQIESMPL
ncbi:MAG: hypothetical protein RJA81_122 [Planctomycetota bacterium]|jgi:septum formation protein